MRAWLDTHPIQNARQAVSDAVKEVIGKIDPDVRMALGIAYFTSIMAVGASIFMGMPREEMPYGLKPEAIVGPIPLYSIQEIERAKSDRKLKVRALGDVFLAHQKGNRDVLKISGTLQGPFRFIYLWSLITLQATSEGKQQSLLKLGSPIPEGQINIGDKITTKQGMLNYETHKTYPVITQFAILTDMFLQTIEWHRTIEDGQDVIKYHLIFRKWIPPVEFSVFGEKTEDGELISAKSFELHSGEMGKMRKKLEFTIDFIWKMIRMSGEIYGHLLINSDGSQSWELDQQGVSSMTSLVTSYQGKLFGIFLPQSAGNVLSRFRPRSTVIA